MFRKTAMNLIFVVLLILCCGYALVWGGAPERITAAAYVVAVALTHATHSVAAVPFEHVDATIFFIDLGVFSISLLIALRAERFWPLWFTAFLGLGLIAHAAMITSPEVVPRAYAFLITAWSYPILFILAGATRCHRQRLARWGRDPAWSDFSAAARGG
jgi:hypothetical protein